MSTARLPGERLPAALEPILRQRLPVSATARIRQWAPSPRGFATETYLFEVVDENGCVPLVFRRPPELSLFPDYDLLRQVLVMERLADTDLPVATVRWLDRSDTALGSPYFVMDRLDPHVEHPLRQGLSRDRRPRLGDRPPRRPRIRSGLAAVPGLGQQRLRGPRPPCPAPPPARRPSPTTKPPPACRSETSATTRSSPPSCSRSHCCAWPTVSDYPRTWTSPASVPRVSRNCCPDRPGRSASTIINTKAAIAVPVRRPWKRSQRDRIAA